MLILATFLIIFRKFCRLKLVHYKFVFVTNISDTDSQKISYRKIAIIVAIGKVDKTPETDRINNKISNMLLGVFRLSHDGKNLMLD